MSRAMVEIEAASWGPTLAAIVASGATVDPDYTPVAMAASAGRGPTVVVLVQAPDPGGLARLRDVPGVIGVFAELAIGPDFDPSGAL